jgi:hypothetical protein
MQDLPDILNTDTLSRADERQQARLPNGYKPLSVAGMTFDPRLTFELALGLSASDKIFERYGYDQDSALALAKNPIFQAAYKAYVDDVKEHGITFRAKARIQAEDLLAHSYEIATDTQAPYAVRADMIKWTAKVADYEPKPNVADAPSNGFALQIVFSGDSKKEPLLVQGQTITQEKVTQE